MSGILYKETSKRGQGYVSLTKISKSVETPVLVMAKIKVHGLKRDPTPECHSGFTCSDEFKNPFEYGHVMSWEMGGPNETTNIVPMYGRWQANVTATGSPHRSWRDMEVEIKTLARGKPNQFIYVALVEYKPSGKTYESQSAAFGEWRQLFDWEESRIPVKFRVYVEPVSSDYGKLLCEQFLTPAGLGKNADAERDKLLAGTYGGKPVFKETWDHSKLPPQDRDFLLRNMAANATDIAMAEHEAKKEAQVLVNKQDLTKMDLEKGEKKITAMEIDEWANLPMSPAHGEDTYFYIEKHSQEIKDFMINEYGCMEKDANGLTTATIHRAVNHGDPAKRNVKIWTKRMDEKKKIKREALLKAQKDARFNRFEASRKTTTL